MTLNFTHKDDIVSGKIISMLLHLCKFTEKINVRNTGNITSPCKSRLHEKKFKYRYTLLLICFVIKHGCCAHFQDLKQILNKN